LAKEANVVSSLAGKVAGVVVSKTTSGPGGGTRVIIRGNNSLNGDNQPLYVIDGVPLDNSSGGPQAGAAEYSVPDYGTGVSDINADDIESMTVLKGPNAAALYGSRASNGVVLITTKKGALGKGIGISFTSSASFDDPMILPEYQNEYGRGTNGEFPDINATDPLATQVNTVTSTSSWGPRFDGSQQLEFNGQLRPYSAQPNNVEDFFETATNLVNTIAIQGGGEKTSVRFSYTNSDIGSILPNSNLKKNNFNLRGFAKLGDKFTFDAKMTYFLQEMKNRPTQGTEGVSAYLWRLTRNVNLLDLQHYQDLDNPIDPDQPYRVIAPTSSGGNPYWMLFENHNEDTRNRFSGFAKLQYEFSDYLTAFIRIGTDNLNSRHSGWTAFGNHFFSSGRLDYGWHETSESNYDFLLMFNKDLNDQFNLSVNAGGNALHAKNITGHMNGRDFQIPGKYFLGNTDGTQISANTSDLIEKKIHSVYGQASVSYDKMVYLDVTARNDWSSALPAENRSYFYSSESLSLLIHKLFNFGDSDINFAKLRASTAQVGKDTGPQQIVNLFNIAGTGYLGNIQVGRSSVKFSESLKPEQVTSNEFGLELKAFQNRLYADFAVYKITTKDLIFDVPVDPGTGYSAFRENIGKLTNDGWELMIGGTPIRNDNFEWDISANISGNDNKLVSLIEGQERFTFSTSNGGEVDVRAQVGEGYGDIYTKEWLRNDAGQIVVTDEGIPQAASERTKSGNYQPDYTGGVINTLNYKNFSLNFLIDFRIGGDVYSATDAGLDASGVSKRSLEYREGGIVVDGVKEDGTANTTSISAQQYWGAVSGISSEYVYDQSNARLRELTLSYKFPEALLADTFIQNATLSLTGRNLFFLWKEVDNFDPEASYSTNNFGQGVLYYALPTTRSLGVSLNVNF
jgi:TonB-linked SusC/RagA family outer membrane protein